MREIFERYSKAIITAAGVIVFIIAGMITMIFTDSGNEPPTQNPPPQSQTANPEPRTSESNQPSKTIYVYITGEVSKPGVYKLSEDSRIFQLVEMAGGLTRKADAESLNLAENVVDGAHVHIGTKLTRTQMPQNSPTIPGMPARTTTVTPPQSQPSSARVNINTANVSELESLPGIGPALAQRIIDYRTKNGNFARPEDLVNVKGIGKSKLAQILPHVTAMSTGTRVVQPQSSAGLIDINRATQKELERLPGVGKVTAQRIIDYRNQHGRFTKPEDLTNVRGISSAKLEKMRSMIVIR